MSSCIFCKIISGEAPGEIYYQDDEILVFKDIKPASKFHFLAVPKEHIHNVNSLTKDHIPLSTIMFIIEPQVEFLVLVQRFISKSKEILSEKGGSVDDIRFGFHLPPFNSVSHLHLHVISPASEMSYLSRLIFKPNSWWFASVRPKILTYNLNKFIFRSNKF